MGFVSEIIAAGSRKPVFGYHAMVVAITAIGFLGWIVWGHHMFQSGMNTALGATFMATTMVIAVPSAIKTFNWLATMWRGDLHFHVPMLHAVAFVSMFVIGGLSGVFLASTPVDIFLHDTYFVVAHIHYVLFGGSLFALFGAITFWYPKMFGRMMNEGLGKIHFWLTLIFFNATFWPMHQVGLGGMMRRIYDPLQYEHIAVMQPTNRFITLAAFALMATQFIFAFNFLWSLFKGRVAEKNPWHANSLEWTVPSPPPHGNFVGVMPVVHRGPYEYSSPESDADYLPQDRPPTTRQSPAVPVN
jgi:cytochrome c oxidase subunit 1